jgi:orotate phosphoribosyltransferase
MSLRRGFTLDPGARAVVVEDVITTGGSTREVIEIVQAAGGTVAAAGSIIDRSNGTANLGVPYAALHSMTVTAYQPDACPLCAEGLPVIKPGSRPV